MLWYVQVVVVLHHSQMPLYRCNSPLAAPAPLVRTRPAPPSSPTTVGPHPLAHCHLRCRSHPLALLTPWWSLVVCVCVALSLQSPRLMNTTTGKIAKVIVCASTIWRFNNVGVLVTVCECDGERLLGAWTLSSGTCSRCTADSQTLFRQTSTCMYPLLDCLYNYNTCQRLTYNFERYQNTKGVCLHLWFVPSHDALAVVKVVPLVLGIPRRHPALWQSCGRLLN